MKSQPDPKNEEKQIDPEIIHIRELENATKQIELYRNEIDFLKKRNEKGGQIDTIKLLAVKVQDLEEEEARLEHELKGLNTGVKAVSNKLKKLTENKEHDSKVGSLDDADPSDD